MKRIIPLIAISALVIVMAACGGDKKRTRHADSIYVEAINTPAHNSTLEQLWAQLEDQGMIDPDCLDQAIEVTMDRFEQIDHAISQAESEDDLADAFNVTAEVLVSSDALKTARIYRYLMAVLNPETQANDIERLRQNHDDIITRASNIQRRVRGEYAEQLADAIDLFANE